MFMHTTTLSYKMYKEMYYFTLYTKCSNKSSIYFLMMTRSWTGTENGTRNDTRHYNSTLSYHFKYYL